MTERPHSHFTREKTWAALYNQHINACYVLVPFSSTSNSIDVLKCQSPAEAQITMRRLLKQAAECEEFYTKKRTRDQAPEMLKKAQQAVVLAKSSDYYHYHLADRPDFRLVICGLHDSYLHMAVWETSTNRYYKPRETTIAIDSPEFMASRKTKLGHPILLGALINGDEHALALLNALPARTRRRIQSEISDLQSKRYHGRPLTFHDDSERREVGDKIRTSLIRYHAQRKA